MDDAEWAEVYRPLGHGKTILVTAGGRNPARHPRVPAEREHLAPRARPGRHRPGRLLPLPDVSAHPWNPGGPADVRRAAAGLDLPARRARHPDRYHRALSARDPPRAGPVRPDRVHRPAAGPLQPAD